jgi:glycosyltransferase involved in cell wall biosynthesis
MRVLLLGPVNVGHFEDQAAALAEHGIDVVAAGELWPGPPTGLDGAEIVRGPFVPWLRRVVRVVRPDVVHAHWTPFAAKALVARARPLVVQPWGSDVYRATAPFRLANRLVARFAQSVVADSADLRDAMVALGAPADRTAVIGWGVDLARFRPDDGARSRLGLDAGPLIVSPRALKPFYNPAAIVAAYERVRERVPEARLVLKHTEDAPPAHLGGLPEGVRVVGRVPYAEMADWYRAADVCVSIPDTDSSPRSVWEAMACGTPCVVSDLPWARAELRDGEDALLVPPRADAVAAALERVLTDPALAARLAAAGRARAQERDRDAETRKLIALYEGLVQARSRTS